MEKRFQLILGLFFILALSFGNQAFAQLYRLNGTVIDAADGSSIPGVSILVKGTTLGTTTDLDGKYILEVKSGYVLVFSFVGYEKQEILITDQKVLNVSLASSVTGLNEVVIIGYGQVKKGDATGSVSAVGTKDFNIGAITSPADLLTGKVAGVQITSSGGAPGAGSTIRIRGGSSLSASNDPLFVIDGVPVDNDGISGTRSALSTINPSDIETFTVLKDASATAIYGSRASNGVILITTKKGKEGKPLSLDYTGTFSFYQIPKTIEVLKGDEYRAMIQEKYAGNDNVLSLLNDDTQSTDWQEQIFRNAFGMDHTISGSGAIANLPGKGVLPYRISAGYSNYDGILKTDNMQRTNLGFSLNPKLFDNHLKIDLSGKYMGIKQRFGNEGSIGAAIQFDPTKPIMDAESPYGGYWVWQQANGDPVTQATSNPVAMLELREDDSDVNRFLGNAQFDYRFHFLPELKANLNLGMDRSNSDGTVYVPGFASFSFDKQNGGGVNRVYDQEKKNELLDFYLNYNKYFDNIKSQIDVMGGYSWQHFWRRGSTYETNDLTGPFFIKKLVRDSTDYETENYLVSFFGRLNYTFNDKYLLTFTLRNDGSSRFSPDTRWGLFPSAAFAWKINDEAFLKDYKVLTNLKLRLGWGVTGQQNISDNDYPYQARYTFGEPNAAYQFGGIFFQTLRPEGYDANIKWEETTTTNVGIDYGFANDRISGSLDYYVRKTKDLINFIPIPAGTNLSNYLLTNIGDMENKGFEFAISGKPISKPDMFWEVGFNFTLNENKITKLTATDDSTYLGVFVGGIAGGVGNTVQIHSVGKPSYSFYVFEQVYDADGKPIEGMYVDRNDDGQITDADRYHYKSPNPKYYIGINSRFNYKNWDFSFAGRANIGNYMYNNVSSNNGVYERLYRPEGPYLSNITADVDEVGFTAPQYLSDYYIQEATFFRMDNIGVSYLFSNLFNDKVKLRLSATVNNAFVITNYKGIDPEVGGGIDNNIYPRTRIYALGVNLQF